MDENKIRFFMRFMELSEYWHIHTNRKKRTDMEFAQLNIQMAIVLQSGETCKVC